MVEQLLAGTLASHAYPHTLSSPSVVGTWAVLRGTGPQSQLPPQLISPEINFC